jgi:hypothetical protein
MNEPIKLHCFIDGELSADELRQVELELAKNPAVAAEYERILRLKSFLVTHAETFDSEETWKICSARLVEIDRTKRVDRFVTRNAWGLCAVIFCSIMVGGLWQRNNSASVSNTEVATMMSSFTPERSGKTFTSDEKKWVQGIFSSAENSIKKIWVDEVMEGRLDTGRLMRRYKLHDAEGPMVLDVIGGITNVNGMNVHGTDEQYKSGRFGESTTIAWIKDGSGVFLTAQRDPESLVEIAKKICPSN